MPDGAHPKGVSVDSADHRAYVTADDPNRLIVIDTQTDSVISAIPLDFNPIPGQAWAKVPVIFPSRDEVYISNFSNNEVVVYDTNTLVLKNTIAVSGNPYLIAINENTNRVYVTIYDSNVVLGLVDVIDAETHTVIDSIAVGYGLWGIGVNPVTNKIYVSSARNSPGLTVIDGFTNSIVATLNFDYYSNHTIAVDPFLDRVYVLNMFEGAIYVVDGSTNSLITKIIIQELKYYRYPFGLVLDPELHKLYTGTSNATSFVEVVDTISNSPVQRINVYPPTAAQQSNLRLLGIDTDLHKVYAPHYGNSFIAVIAEENTPPVADAGLDISGNEGNLLNFDGSGSTDPDGVEDIVSYDWDFGDGHIGSGVTTQHSYDDNGVYTATLTVTDAAGEIDTDTVIVTVNNVAPTAVLSITPDLIIEGESSTLSIDTQYDPGVDDAAVGFLYSFDCTNDGVFEVTDVVDDSYVCNYPTAGNFTAKGQIKDKDGGYSYYTVSITVQTPSEAISDMIDLVTEFNLQQGIDNSLDAKLDSALNAFDDVNQNNDAAAINSLQAFINSVEAQRENNITNEQADELINAVQAIINSLSS